MVIIVSKIADHRYDLGVKDQGQTYLKSVLKLVTWTTLVIFDRGTSYLAQIVSMVCRLQQILQRLQVIAMTLGLKVKVRYTYKLFYSSQYELFLYFMI